MDAKALAMASEIAGLILAGGLARRLGGGDKCLVKVAGQPILAHVLKRLRPQVGRILLNANGDPQRFVAFDLPVVPDSLEGFLGPLAGILAGLEWARVMAPEITHLVSVPGDSPFVPSNLVERLASAARAAAKPLAFASSGGQAFPVIGFWPVSLADDLRLALVEEGLRKVDLWTTRHGIAEASWPSEPFDPFFNINTPDDLVKAEAIAARLDL